MGKVGKGRKREGLEWQKGVEEEEWEEQQKEERSFFFVHNYEQEERLSFWSYTFPTI